MHAIQLYQLEMMQFSIAKLAASFILVSYLAYASALKMVATYIRNFVVFLRIEQRYILFITTAVETTHPYITN
jgi:hypothetical protein